MKKIFTIALMATLATGMSSCRQKQVGEQPFVWLADRFVERGVGGGANNPPPKHQGHKRKHNKKKKQNPKKTTRPAHPRASR